MKCCHRKFWNQQDSLPPSEPFVHPALPPLRPTPSRPVPVSPRPVSPCPAPPCLSLLRPSLPLCWNSRETSIMVRVSRMGWTVSSVRRVRSLWDSLSHSNEWRSMKARGGMLLMLRGRKGVRGWGWGGGAALQPLFGVERHQGSGRIWVFVGSVCIVCFPFPQHIFTIARLRGHPGFLDCNGNSTSQGGAGGVEIQLQ